jgi:two-component system chemotaxis sensor kinase CheA
MDESNLDSGAGLRQSFIEETRLILVGLDSALCDLTEDPGDLELVDRIFRGLHTITGSGAMFGFDELAAFTQNIEAAFREIRCGHIQVDSGMIALTRSALSQIRAMLEEGAEDTPGPDRSRS